MVIIFFSGNLHKAREIEAIFAPFRVRIYTNFMKPFEVVECGKSFSENAKIKLNALKNAIESQGFENIFKGEVEQKDCILMAEDSGICVESLDNFPHIFSARFANLPPLHLRDSLSLAEGARGWVDSTDSENVARLIRELKAKDLSESKAQFISCVACCKISPKSQNLAQNTQILTTHGFLNGKVITQIKGKNGFGYDPIFIPNGFNQTLGELDAVAKNALSHRASALKLMALLLK